MRVLGERVHDPVVHVELLEVGHVLPPDRVAGRLDEVYHGGRDPELKVFGRLPQPLQLRNMLGAEALREHLQRGEALLTE